jgi:hypothetical protein
MKSKHVGMGVVICEDVINIDQDFLFEYMNWIRKNQEDTFTYIEEDGVEYAINKTGFKFKLEDVKQAPQRFLDTKGKQLNSPVPQKYIDFIDSLENAVYDALVEYCCYFPDAGTTSWWRPTGHIAGYENGQRIGQHCDDQVPYEWGKPTGNQVSMHNSSSINLYLNECVDSKDELNKIRQEILAIIVKSKSEVENLFEKGEFNKVSEILNLVKFYSNILEQVNSKL